MNAQTTFSSSLAPASKPWESWKMKLLPRNVIWCSMSCMPLWLFININHMSSDIVPLQLTSIDGIKWVSVGSNCEPNKCRILKASIFQLSSGLPFLSYIIGLVPFSTPQTFSRMVVLPALALPMTRIRKWGHLNRFRSMVTWSAFASAADRSHSARLSDIHWFRPTGCMCIIRACQWHLWNEFMKGLQSTENCAMAMAGLSLSDNQNVGMVYCTWSMSSEARDEPVGWEIHDVCAQEVSAAGQVSIYYIWLCLGLRGGCERLRKGFAREGALGQETSNDWAEQISVVNCTRTPIPSLYTRVKQVVPFWDSRRVGSKSVYYYHVAYFLRATRMHSEEEDTFDSPLQR